MLIKKGYSYSKIAYALYRRGDSAVRFIASDKIFNRDISSIEGVAENGKTATFPKTITRVRYDLFRHKHLKSIIFNEGLERLGECREEDGNYHAGLFCYGDIKHITLPSTLKVLGDETFNDCSCLSRVAFRQTTAEGGSDGLQELRYGEAVLPATLELIGYRVLAHCPRIKVIWVEDLSLVKERAHAYFDGTVTLLARSTMVGDQLLWDLRRTKDVVIP